MISFGFVFGNELSLTSLLNAFTWFTHLFIPRLMQLTMVLELWGFQPAYKCSFAHRPPSPL